MDFRGEHSKCLQGIAKNQLRNGWLCEKQTLL
jgi:hypothetical protein